MIQEYIPGDDDSLRTVTMVYGDSGRLIGGFSARKLRQHPRGGGVTASGISTRDAALLELVRPFFDAWRWRGPAEVELKHDARHGTYRVIEINPRFPGYLRHASRCGVELAECAVRAALGDEPRGGRRPPSLPRRRRLRGAGRVRDVGRPGCPRARLANRAGGGMA